MGLISDTQVLERFMESGRDPRFLALVGAGWKFFSGSRGWVFPFRQNEEVTMIGAEPLGLSDAGEGLPEDLAEFCAATHPEILVFTALSRPLALVLRSSGPRFRLLRTGTDARPMLPLAALTPPAPAPENGRDHRDADFKFAEWDPAELDPGSPKRLALETFYHERASANLAEGSARWLAPGLFASEAVLSLSGMKRYFVLQAGGAIAGLCVVTPIPAPRAGWIRDFMVTGEMAAENAERLLRGVVGELRESGVERLWMAEGCGLAKGHPSTESTPLYMLYRAQPGSGFWPVKTFRLALGAVLRSAPPRLQLSVGRVLQLVYQFALRWPTTFGIALCIGVPFIAINGLGGFPAWALDRSGAARGGVFGFTWWGRSILGGFLLPGRRELFTLALPLVGSVAWLERKRGSVVTPVALLLSAVLSPLMAQLLLFLPLRLVHPDLFSSGALATPMIGGQWMLAALLGFAFGSGIRRAGAVWASWILTAAVCLGVLFAALGAPDHASLVLFLSLIPVFVIAYGAGSSFNLGFSRAALKTPPAIRTMEETHNQDGSSPLCEPESVSHTPRAG